MQASIRAVRAELPAHLFAVSLDFFSSDAKQRTDKKGRNGEREKRRRGEGE